MKKFTAFLLTSVLTISLLLSTAISVWAEDENPVNQPSITMAINENIVMVNDVQFETTAPLLVLDKTYVDLYAIAPLMGIGTEWVQDNGGFPRLRVKGKTADFIHISQWNELINLKYRFFIKDNKIFVQLRELADLAECVLTYNDGLIKVGNVTKDYSGIYGDIDTSQPDEFVYGKYPCRAEYVVNPYKAYSHEDMMRDAKKLQQMYPDLIKLSSIGKSVENRDLLLVEFGRGENKIFVCGTHHAREYIATTYIMYAIDRYAYAYRGNSMWGQYMPREILDKVTFCIVPMVNPDGVNLVQNGIYATEHAEALANMKVYEGAKYGYYAWKANVNGVDVNWNYDKDWSAEKNKNPRGSNGFNGDQPNTEPETIAVSNYVDQNSFEVYLSFHTQGQIFYWAEDKVNPPYLHDAIKYDTGFKGYRETATGVGGSFFDYVYRKFRKPTITVELCPYVGNYPYPDSRFDTVWNPAKNIMLVVGNQVIYEKALEVGAY